jgi:hypothetical protein
MSPCFKSKFPVLQKYVSNVLMFRSNVVNFSSIDVKKR